MRAKDEEKFVSPMFPRLHVNDTEKGGPRAPPRNKMALYEQLSIPSQRLSSGSTSMLPVPTNNGGRLVPSISSSHGVGYERSGFTPFCNSPAHSHLAEKVLSYSSGGVKLSTMVTIQEQKSVSAKNDRSSDTTQPLSSSAKCNSFQSQNLSNVKKFSWKKLGDENDFKIPQSTQSGATLHCSNSQHSKDRENQSCLNLSFSMQFQNGSEKQKKGRDNMVLKATECVRTQTEENAKVSQSCQDSVERSTSVPSIKDKPSVNASSSSLGKVNSTESSKRAHPSSNQEYRSSSVDVIKGLHVTQTQLNQESVTRQDKTVLRENLLVEPGGAISKENSCKVRSESQLRLSFGDDNRSPSAFENCSKDREDNECGCLQVGDVERYDDVSETSMVDSISALEITPDDVVGVIGEKQFWKARRAIVNQQRVFAVQVFELHRLIKVQKLIAGSPHLLHEDNFYIGKASLKFSPVRKLPAEYALEQPPLLTKSKDLSQKPHRSTEFADENSVGKLPHPSFNNETSKEHIAQRSNYRSHSAGAKPAPMAANAKPTPWCFPPAGNQWLVPVMSPSDGLVYKPYTGPCRPAAGFMTPVYGSCSPVSVTPGGGDFLNAAYSVPTSHQQGIGILPLGQNYFPPYGMRAVNLSISGSAVEQMSPFTGPHSKDNQLSVGDINFTNPHRSSCSLSSQMSRAISCCPGKFQASKEGEVQGSTASSPPTERAKGDALPLFPTEPTAQVSDRNTLSEEQSARVIKVVPHNPRSATESAARIFRCIQEERKQYD